MTQLQMNDDALDFGVVSDSGEVVQLSDFKGKKNIVLYFYPKDDTPGCTKQAQGFRDLYEKFKSCDTEVIGVSKDTVAKHVKFKGKYDLNFPLLADEELQIIEPYGVWVEKNLYGRKYMGIERATFLINKDGKIVRIWRKVKVSGHMEEVLSAAQAL